MFLTYFSPNAWIQKKLWKYHYSLVGIFLRKIISYGGNTTASNVTQNLSVGSPRVSYLVYGAHEAASRVVWRMTVFNIFCFIYKFFRYSYLIVMGVIIDTFLCNAPSSSVRETETLLLLFDDIYWIVHWQLNLQFQI